MNLRLRTQYTIAIAAITVLTACTLAVVLLYGTNRAVTSVTNASSLAASDRLLGQIYKRGSSITSVISENILNAYYLYDMEEMENILSNARLQPDIVFAYVYEPSGTIVHDGTDDIDSYGEAVDARLLSVVEPGFSASAVTDRSDGVLTVAVPLRTGDETIGGLALGFSLAGINAEMASMNSDLSELGRTEANRALAVLVLATALTVIAGLLVAARTAKVLSCPIARLSEAITAVGRHDWGAHIEAGGSREIVELVGSFNRMTDDLRRTTVSVDRLEEIVHERTGQLRSVNAELRDEVRRREEIEAELIRHRDGLEATVSERTAALSEANTQLRKEMEERLSAEQKRREAEEQLLRSRKMEALGTLAGGVAHDLNNILSGIVSYPELLLRKLPPNSDLRGPLNTIQQSGERAAVVVRDLLTMARRGVATPEILDLNEVVSQYQATPEYAKLIAEHPGVSVETRLAPVPLPMAGSHVHVAKSLMNLVMNACEAMPNGGTVVVSTRAAGGDGGEPVPDAIGVVSCAVLEVSDNGEGMAPEDLDRVFEPFFTRKKLGRSGSGLGMSIVWGTVEDHGGHIEAESVLGEGTRFTLYFPSAKEPAKEDTSSGDAKDYTGHGERVLVVDDVPQQREIATEILRSLGYEAEAVPSGEAAIEYIHGNDCRLLVLDMVMEPGMDGLDTYRRARELCPDVAAIIASGYSESERVREAVRLGVAAYVQKPYLAADLGRAVRSALEAR